MRFKLETGGCLSCKPENLEYVADKDEYTYVTGIYLFSEAQGVWCVELTFPQQKMYFTDGSSRIPVAFKYFLKVGDTITLRDIKNPSDTIAGRLVSASWNKMTFE